MSSNDGWGKGWPSKTLTSKDIAEALEKNKGPTPWPKSDDMNNFINDTILYGQGFIKDGKHVPLSEVFIDKFPNPDITVIVGKMKDGQLIADYFTGEAAQSKIKEYENAVPTHDPYTNPDMCIYHECGCGAILDPNTKSFAELNTAASQVGWKIRWGVDTYKAYCRKCGEGVE